MKKLLLLLILPFVLSCTENKHSDSKVVNTTSRMMTIKSSYMGTTFYNAGLALAYLINTNINSVIAYNSSGELSENEKISAIVSQKADLAFISGPEGYMAYMGHPDYWDDSQNIKALFGFIPTVYNCIVRKDSDIQTLGDLLGHRIALNSLNTVSGDLMLNLLELNNVNGSDTQILRIRENIGERMFLRGEFDAMWYAIGYGHSFFRNLALEKKQGNDYRIIPCSADNKLQSFLSVYPVFYTQNFETENISSTNSLTAYSCLACSGNIKDDEAYKITRLWFENIDYIHQFIKEYNRETALEFALSVPIPLHPGAERYFRESNILR